MRRQHIPILLRPSLYAQMLAATKAKVISDAEDVSILVIGDSTSNESSEWAYLFAAWLGAQYPTHTVDYYLWSDVGGAYDAGTELSSGSGARTISLYNCSVSGSRAEYIQGGRFAVAVDALTPDLVIWNHGHNYVSVGANPLIQGPFSGSLDQVRLAKPNAAHAAFLQNPRRDDSQMAAVNTAWRAVGSEMPDLLLLDVYSRFINAGKPSGWYADNQHPSSSGQAQFLEVIQNAWNACVPGERTQSAAWFATEATNLLANGALASTGTSAPASWTVSGTVAFAREGTIVYPGYASSLAMNGSGAAQTRISQQAAVTAYRGQNLFLAVLLYIPTGADATVGRIALTINGTGGASYTSYTITTVRDGWALWCVGPVTVPADATTATVSLYHDTDGTPDADAVYFQRACLSVGNVPRDFA